MEALERKTRPIYEALDSRKPKTALKLTNAALQKHKDNQLLRVLKALALARLDKADEAYKVCDGVAAEAPIDEQVLNILSMVYKGSEQAGKLIAAYQAAVKARPNDRHLLHVLLTAHIRALHFDKAQQTAMKLHRMKGHDYLWWIVTCLLLQARQAGEEGQTAGNARKLLLLAKSMAQKRLEDPDAAMPYQQSIGKSAEAVRLYLQILQDLKDTEEIGLFLVGPFARLVYPTDVERSLAKALSHAEQGSAEVAARDLKGLAEHHALDSSDVLHAYLEHILASHPSAPRSSSIAANGHVVEVATADDSDESQACSSAWPSARHLQEAEKVMQRLQCSALASCTPAAKARAPLLAAVHLEWRKHTSGLADGPGISSELLSEAERARLESGRAAGPSGRDNAAEAASSEGAAVAVLVAFKKLGHLASYAADVRKYTSQIRGWVRQWLASELRSICQLGEDAQSNPLNLASLQQQVNAYLIEHDLGLPDFESPRQSEEYAASVMKVFRDAADLQQGLDHKERGVADALVSLAVAALVTAWKLEPAPRSSTYLLKALLVLEAAQQSRTHSAPMRLAALALRGLLGAARSAMECFDALAIKHIQHDTLSGHLALPIVLGTLCREGAAELMGDARALYEQHERDAGDTILMAFSAENWTMVLEFVNFKERLAASHARAMAYAELAMHGLTSLPSPSPAAMHEAASAAAHNIAAALPSDLVGLRFNEDLSTRPPWLPPDSGECRLAVPRWWEEVASVPTAGYGRCWWAVPLAGESSKPEAATHRAQCTASLEQRSLLPTLLEASLSHEHAPSAATLEGSLPRLKGSSGPRLENGKQSSGRLTSVERLQSLKAAIFSAAAAVQAALAADEAAEQAALQASQQLEELKHQIDELIRGLLPDLEVACRQAIWTGAATFVAAAFASEEALWLAMCLQAWLKPKHAKKGKKGAEPKANNASDTSNRLIQNLRNCQDALRRGNKDLLEHLHAITKRDSETLLEELCSRLAGNNQAGTSDLSRELWAWENQLDVRETLSAVNCEQTEFISAVQLRLQMIQQLL